jgi:hypothetical protein
MLHHLRSTTGFWLRLKQTDPKQAALTGFLVWFARALVASAEQGTVAMTTRRSTRSARCAGSGRSLNSMAAFSAALAFHPGIFRNTHTHTYE